MIVAFSLVDARHLLRNLTRQDHSRRVRASHPLSPQIPASVLANTDSRTQIPGLRKANSDEVLLVRHSANQQAVVLTLQLQTVEVPKPEANVVIRTRQVLHRQLQFVTRLHR